MKTTQPGHGMKRQGGAPAQPPRRAARRLGLLVLLLLLPAGPALAQPKEIVHSWKRIYYASLDGKESLLFAERFDRARPALGDMDGDGDLDLFLGRGDGRIMYFENQGSKTRPRWRLVNESISAQDQGTRAGEETFHTIDVGGNSAPALVDLDGDGDLDLLVGSASGAVVYYVNAGNRFLTTFRLENPDFLGKRLGLNLVVKFPDLNGDGLPDLSAGNEAGEFVIALNQGTRSEPRYCLQQNTSPNCLSVLTPLGRLDPEDNAAPEWVDWDGDGDLDLLVGKSDGTIAHYQNIGDAHTGNWEQAASRFLILDAGGYAAPAFADVTGDGRPDLLLAGDKEQVALYERRQERKLPLWLADKNVLQVRHLGGFQSRVRLTAADLTGDGKPELMLGSRGGQLLVFINQGSKDNLAFRSPTEALLPTPQRAFSAPALGDLDGDGDQDLLVGGREGRLEWIENHGGPKEARWRFRSLFYAKVDVGAVSVPVLGDLDGDQDLDLLVGNSLGNVVFYENVGSVKQPGFALRSIRFAGLQTAPAAAPSLFGWNPEGPPDLVVGSQRGTLLPAVRNPAIKITEPRAYAPQPAWSGLGAAAHSAPLFANLTGNAGPDLLVGSDSGAVLLWQYEGSGDQARLAAAGPQGRANIVEDRVSTSTAPPSLAGLDPTAPPGTAPGAAPAQPETTAPAPPENLPIEPIFVHEASPLEKLDPMRASRPAFFDFNGDGLADLVVGTRDGRLLLFINAGGQGKDWRKVTERLAGYRNGRNAAPAFADLDGDGDTDLLVGNEAGQVGYWENTGTSGKPRFTRREKLLTAIRTGNNAIPTALDLNRDGRPDLVVGNLKGELMLYLHDPKATGVFKLENRRFLSVDMGVNAAPATADLTNSNTAYLLVGSDQGRMRIFRATQTSLLRSSGWRENMNYLEGLKFSPGSHPALADIDGDGDLDLILGSDRGPLRLFRNQARGGGG